MPVIWRGIGGKFPLLIINIEKEIELPFFFKSINEVIKKIK